MRFKKHVVDYLQGTLEKGHTTPQSMRLESLPIPNDRLNNPLEIALSASDGDQGGVKRIMPHQMFCRILPRRVPKRGPKSDP